MVDWGTVPGWLGAGSLILAFVVFNRDHANAERAQVDLVAAWGEGDYDHRMPGEAEVVEAAISMCLRNASELAVFVKQLAYEVHTRWYVEDREQPMISWDLVDASEPQHLFVDDLQLAPGEAKELPPIKVNLAHLAPEGSRQLAFPGGVKVRVTWLLLIDNASRRWIIRPLGGHAGTQDQVVVEAGPEEYAAQVVAKRGHNLTACPASAAPARSLQPRPRSKARRRKVVLTPTALAPCAAGRRCMLANTRHPATR